MAYGSNFGGISAVNPQAQGDYQDYINQSMAAWKTYADPMFDQQSAAFNQDLVNRGIPVGGEAWGEAFTTLDASQKDAATRAMFDAMGFGLGAQNQDFSQDLARSQLANALLQAQWSDETARYGIDKDYSLGMENIGLGYAGLDEQGRQFDLGLGLDYDQLGELARQFDNTLSSDLYQFDSTLDYNYWDRANQYSYLYDRADQADLQWLTDFDYGVWNDQNALNQWADLFGMKFLDPYTGTQENLSPITSNQYANNALYQTGSRNTRNWWDDVASIADSIINRT